jgi:subtilisin family serine protease/PKD repeat protein
MVNILIISMLVFIVMGDPVAAVGLERTPLRAQSAGAALRSSFSMELEDIHTGLPFADIKGEDQPQFDPRGVLVKFKSGMHISTGPTGIDLTAMDLNLANQRVEQIQPLFSAADDPASSMQARADNAAETELTRMYELTLAQDGDVERVIAVLNEDPAVEWAEPDYLAYAADTIPNDPLFAGQWGLSQIDAPGAWDVVTGTPLVVIAVLDSGLDMSHPDLADRVWTNPGEVPGDGVDNDVNNHIDDIHGWDFIYDDNDPSDDNGHGTQVAGIAAATTDNGSGMAGVCWNCEIMPVKVMQMSGVANYSDIVKGIYYAAEKGAEIINISLGGYSDSSALQEAIQYALEKDAVVVAGAGNDNVSTPFYPAAYPEVLAVAGTTESDTKAAFSNYGSWIDVSAPGEAITSTFLGGGYGPVNGTSFAAPYASGLAALLRSQHTDWSEALVRAQIVHRSDSIEALNPTYTGQLGSGRINANTAVSQPPHPILQLESTAVNSEANGRPTPGEEASLEVTLSNDWLDAAGVVGTLTTSDSYVTVGQASANFGDIPAGATGIGTPIYTFTVDSATGYNYVIPFEIDVRSNEGAYTTTLPVTVTTRSANEPFCGTISENMTWTNDKTYIIQCNVGVAPGYTLTIQPGTEVLFDGAYDFNIGGTLIADGAEAQPIRFASDTGSDWGHINFDDSSTDATVDTAYEYVNGSILRHTEIEDTEGIIVDQASPYMSHISVVGGVGLEWTPGTLTVGSSPTPAFALLTDSYIWADLVPCGVLINGDARYVRNEVAGDSRVDINGQATVIENTGVAISTNGGSYAYNNTVDSVSVNGAGTVISNSVTGISVGNDSQVLTNTLTSGSILVGDNSEVRNNNIEDGSGWGLQSSGAVTATANRLVGNQGGVRVGGGWIQGNLIANNEDVGLELNGNTTVISNTFTGNSGTSVRITGSPWALAITGNNFEHNHNTYEIENLVDKSTLMMVPAQDNWWGTTDNAEIDQRIFDYNDDYNKGQVLYAPTTSGPIQTAPAYVRSITLTPESPVGIEEVVFDVEFSREMDLSLEPSMSFRSVQYNTWDVYNTSNSELPDDNVFASAIDARGDIWFGTLSGGAACLHDSEWTVYNTNNSGLPNNSVLAIATDAGGNIWFGTEGGAARFDGSDWISYYASNSGLPDDYILSLATGTTGNVWFGTIGKGAAHFNDSEWTVYDSSNSELPPKNIMAIAVDTKGDVWFGIVPIGGNTGGVVNFDGAQWSTYGTDQVESIGADTEGNIWIGTMGNGVRLLKADGTWYNYESSNSGLSGDYVRAVFIDTIDNKWFGTVDHGVSVLRADNSWQTYDPSDSGLANVEVRAIAVDTEGNKWFGTADHGVSVLWGGTKYVVSDNTHWLMPTHYQATYDFNARIPRDAYSITVQSARGTDGVQIAPNTATAFTVDYAGAIGDSTPPEAPSVIACGADNPDTLSAQWTADDSDGTITLYRYAIGTNPGDTDIVNWTETQQTSFLRSDLNLNASQTYYVAVQARNTGGLWSEFGISNGVDAGSGNCPSADFSGAPVEGSAPLEVQFTDTSAGTVDTWLWDFGDEITSTLENPSHLYDESGVYTVSLQVFGPGGGDFIVKPDLINVQNFEIYLPLTLRSYASRSSAINTIIGGEND